MRVAVSRGIQHQLFQAAILIVRTPIDFTISHDPKRAIEPEGMGIHYAGADDGLEIGYAGGEFHAQHTIIQQSPDEASRWRQ